MSSLRQNKSQTLVHRVGDVSVGFDRTRALVGDMYVWSTVSVRRDGVWRLVGWVTVDGRGFRRVRFQ